MAVKTNQSEKKNTPNIKRLGVHAKSKQSNLKSSKNYTKSYRGQGR